MLMNLILLYDSDFVDRGRARLSGRRFRHIMEVLRAGAGDELCVGLAEGLIGKGKVVSCNDRSLEMEVDVSIPPPHPLPVTLILSLPRPKALRRILLSASALGVKKIVLLNAYRVEKSFWQSPVLQEEHVKRQLVLGLEQSRDTVLPEVIIRKRFKPFVEDELPGLIAGTRPVVFHPGAAGPFHPEPGRPSTVAVGPEGGFLPYEIGKLEETGFSAVSLGERILNVETAVPFILSRLS